MHKPGSESQITSEAVIKAEANRLIYRKAREYAQLVSKEAIDKISQEIKPDLMEAAMKADNVELVKHYIAAQIMADNIQLEIIRMLYEKEMKKRRPKVDVLQWIHKAINEQRKANGEIRKANLEQREMTHGKRSVNINAQAKAKPSLEALMDLPDKKLEEEESEENDETVQGKPDNSGEKSGD